MGDRLPLARDTVIRLARYQFFLRRLNSFFLLQSPLSYYLIFSRNYNNETKKIKRFTMVSLQIYFGCLCFSLPSGNLHRQQRTGKQNICVQDQLAVEVLILERICPLSRFDPHNFCLLGDPQQLQQPQQASHPDGSDISALEYFSGSNKTMPPEQGLFLAETWRLHPDICKFTSAAFYEDRLSPRERPNDEPYQCIESEYRVSGSGLRYLPVLHAGNQSSSMEEALAVKQLINELEQSTLSLSKATKESKTLTPEDILIITPFNAQIAVLTELLPDYASRIGTVDRFQGQESAVVIYSMASSSADDAPRGMGFLYDPNRLNVATSRAQILCIVVASAELFKPKCKTPADMAMANGLCVFRELAEELPSLA